VSRPASFRIESPKVVYEVFDDEVVIINLETGVYYSLNGLGAEIWTRIEETDDVVLELAARYQRPAGDVEAAVRPFLDGLVAEGLVAPDPRANGERRHRTSGATAVTRVSTFEAPVLHKYSDMQELLLLDPIHEVDEVGWPVRPNEPDGDGRKDPP